MKTNAATLDYKGFRFPPEIISHAFWLSFRFSLSNTIASSKQVDNTQKQALVQKY